MRRPAELVAVLVALVAVVILLPAESGGAGRAPSRLLVTGDEYSLVLSRVSLRRGPALIQFVNRGEDPHDLRLRRMGSRRTLVFPELRPGGLSELDARLRTGRYRLWCSLPGHAALGMRAVLRVRRR
jgi:hypothetical protein